MFLRKWFVILIAGVIFSILAQASLQIPESPSEVSLDLAAAASNSWSFSISANPASGRAPLTAAFVAEVKSPTNNSDYSLSWSFGDGGRGSGTSTTHTYLNDGTYKVTCSLRSGTTRLERDLTMVVAPSVTPLTASAAANPIFGYAPLDVAFYSSVNGGQSPYSFYWEFGDGHTSGVQTPTHRYAGPGTYTATLTVSDSSRPKQQAVTRISIAVEKIPSPPLQVSFSANQTNGLAPLMVSFAPSVSGGTPLYRYSWDFGTGDTSSSSNPTYVFATPGLKYVTLTVQDSGTQMAQAKYTVAIVVNEAPPPEWNNDSVATISGSSSQGGVPLTIQFNSIVNGGNPAYDYDWNFGDGGTSSDSNPEHTFLRPGQYYVHLNVTDSTAKIISSNTLVVSVEGNSSISGSSGSGGNPLGALLATVAFGSIAVASLLMQVIGKRKKKTSKGKGGN